MNIELARPSDIGALVELRLAYLAEDFGALDANVADALAAVLPGYFQAHLGRELYGVVARDGARIAACALLLIVEKPPSPAFPSGRTGTVMNVYTRPEYRRQGLARCVMQYLIEHARSMDVQIMNLRATDAGYPLYRSVGFTDDVNKYHAMVWRG